MLLNGPFGHVVLSFVVSFTSSFGPLVGMWEEERREVRRGGGGVGKLSFISNRGMCLTKGYIVFVLFLLEKGYTV